MHENCQRIVSELRFSFFFESFALGTLSYQSHHARSVKTCTAKFTLEYAFVEGVNGFVVAAQLANKSLSFTDLKEIVLEF